MQLSCIIAPLAMSDVVTADSSSLLRLYGAQKRLVTAVQDLSLAWTLPAIQEVVRHAAREIAGADGATFVLRDGDKCYYADEDAIAPLWKGQRFPMSVCVSGWVMTRGRSVAIRDIYDDPRVPVDAYRPTFVKSLVMVPIRVNAPIGAIGTYWATQREASAEEVGLLQALANTTAVAMENVQVYLELEQRVVLRTRELEAVNHELEAFSYSVSHDLRAPLRAINGFLELYRERVGAIPDEKARHFLDNVQTGAAQMSRLIEDLLRLSRVTQKEVQRTQVDLAAIAREIVARLRAGEPARQVEVVVAESLPVSGDAGLLAVLLENLLANAWKYTGRTEHPRIEVGMARRPDEPPAFFVRDNGAGFDPQRATNLFRPFQRLHAAAEFAGTGIGLATVQRIVHRHGGQIWAEAAVGQGATFYFTCEPAVKPARAGSGTS